MIRAEWWASAVLAAVLAAPAASWAAEGSAAEPATVEKTAERLRFKVPPDWPIEKRGGIMAPIPIEEYLGRKFKILDAAVQGLEQRVSGLDLKVRVLEDEVKKTRQGLKSAEETAAQ